MPREDRRIYFEPDEIYRALYSLSKQKQLKPPPPGVLMRVEQDESNESKVFVHLKNPAEDSETAVEFSQDFLAAALMLFCRGAGIPLPKSAKKSVHIKDGEVTLRVQI